MRPQARWYVYELIDGRNDSVFYVGKGSGNRYKAHEQQALQGVCSRKTLRIKEIWSAKSEISDIRRQESIKSSGTWTLEILRMTKSATEARNISTTSSFQRYGKKSRQPKRIGQRWHKDMLDLALSLYGSQNPQIAADGRMAAEDSRIGHRESAAKPCLRKGGYVCDSDCSCQNPAIKVCS